VADQYNDAKPVITTEKSFIKLDRGEIYPAQSEFLDIVLFLKL
jgi:hypothetical protein